MVQLIYTLLATLFGGSSLGIALIKAAQGSNDYSQPTILLCLAFVFATLALLRMEATRR